MARSDSEASKSDRELIEETAKRARRIETKVTVIAEELGVGNLGNKPVYDPVLRTVQIKTPKTSLEDILAAIEDDTVMVQIVCHSEYLASVCPG